MFGKILVPIPQEYFPALALRRACELGEVFNAEIHLLYIIEEPMFCEFDRVSSYVLTAGERREIADRIIRQHTDKVSKVVLGEADGIISQKNLKCEKTTRCGTPTEEILKEIREKNIDTALLEYHPESMLRYRILEKSPVPVWIERTRGKLQNILAICTNLAKNEKVPKYALELVDKMKCKLFLVYVVDTAGDTARLVEDGKRFLEKFEKKAPESVSTMLSIGNLERLSDTLATELDADLLLIGRMRKKKHYHFFVSDPKIHIARKSGRSVLMVR